MSQVLIVDDEESICWGLERLLSETGHHVVTAASAEEGLAACRRKPPDLVVLDVRLPGMDGLSAMRQFEQLAAGVPIVVITAFGSLEVAVTAMRNGAFDYLAKPFDLEQVATVIDRALLHGKRTNHPQPARSAGSREEILGKSRAMQEVFKRIALVAPTDASVLITGESGTGKELVARAIHRHSARGSQAFVPVHLASLSPTLVESELFGHVRGAFTGAESTRQGLLELAEQGTVFFDEAGDIPPSVQVKLLRVLEQREVTPVGSTQPVATNFRAIAATNRDLSLERDDAPLRRDLFFRLAAFEITLPPLRERAEDIPLLAEFFLQQVQQPGDQAVSLSRAALHELCRRPWPGNIRQLRHAVEHGALLARGGQIAVEHLPPAESLAPATGQQNLQTAVRAWGRQHLADESLRGQLYQAFLAASEPALFETILENTSGNRAAAADLLGLHRATLRKKLHGNTSDDN